MTTDLLPIVHDCEGCGACCLQLGRPPFFGDVSEMKLAGPLWQDLPENLKNEVLANLDRETGPCHWYDAPSARCLHYDQRPQACRDFEVGGSGCMKARELIV